MHIHDVHPLQDKPFCRNISLYSALQTSLEAESIMRISIYLFQYKNVGCSLKTLYTEIEIVHAILLVLHIFVHCNPLQAKFSLHCNNNIEATHCT